MIVRRRRFDEYLEAMLEINRYAAGDAWVAGTMLEALRSCAWTARRSGAPERARSIVDIAETIAEQAGGQAENERDRRRIDRLMADIAAGAG